AGAGPAAALRWTRERASRIAGAQRSAGCRPLPELLVARRGAERRLPALRLAARPRRREPTAPPRRAAAARARPARRGGRRRDPVAARRAARGRRGPRADRR